MSGGESGHRAATGRGALLVPIPPPPPSADTGKKRAKRERQRADREAAAKASAFKYWESQAASATEETDPDWKKKHERAVEHNARTTRMYTNFLRVAQQLWVQLPSTSWCSADYDITLPNRGEHVTKDFDYELVDRKKLDIHAMHLTAPEKKHLEQMHAERNNRAISVRHQAVTETWRDTVTLSLQAQITEEIKGPGRTDRMKVESEVRTATNDAAGQFAKPQSNYDPRAPINLRVR